MAEVFVYLDDIVAYAESLEEHDKKAGKAKEKLQKNSQLSL